MKRFFKQLNSSGISLVETVATVVVLSILLISIFSLLIQSGKTTENAENKLDAIYIAQQEMEKLYSHTNSSSVTKGNGSISDCGNFPELCYSSNDSSGKPLIKNGAPYYIKQDSSNSYCIQLEISDIPSYPQLSRVLLQVYDGSCTTGILKAQMENTLEWRNP